MSVCLQGQNHSPVIACTCQRPFNIDTDCNSATELFATFAENDETDVVYAHCGGRYADIELAHDGRSKSIHGKLGHLQWLVGAFRPWQPRGTHTRRFCSPCGADGASYPGAALFGAVGGHLFLTNTLTVTAFLTFANATITRQQAATWTP